tara:strand:+ start:1171 stop:1425 length:255 start_codon:yes stop_codon:yes gene_type:complete
MTIIHILHLKCNKCKNHYTAYDLLSFYDDGEGNVPIQNSEMYDKKCSMCLFENYTLIKDYEYNLEGAQKAVKQRNCLEFKKYNT